MASPLSPLQHATLNNINIPSQPTPASDDYDVVHVSSVTTTHILTEESSSTASLSNNRLPPFVFPSSTKDDFADNSFDMATMDTSANSSPFMNSVVHTVPSHDDDHLNSSSQENVSPHNNTSPSHLNNNITMNAKPVPPPVITSTAPPPPPPSASMTGRQGRPGSRILSGSELSPLKILQGRVSGGPPSSSAASTATTLGSPASPDSGADSRRGTDTADDQASSTASSPPPSYPPSSSSRRMSSSSNGQMLPPALPLGRTPRKFTGPDKRFPVKISVPSVISSGASVASSGTASPVGPRSPMQLPVQHVTQPVVPALNQQQQQSVPGSPSQQAGQAMFVNIQKQQKPLHGRQMSLDEAIQLNEGLKQAIEIFEDEASVIEAEPVGSSSNGSHHGGSNHGGSNHGGSNYGGSNHGSGHSEDGHIQRHRTPHQPYRRRDSLANSNSARNSPAPPDDGAAGMDDTMASTFSTFSAVPNSAMLGRLGRGNSTHGTSSPFKPPPPADGFGHHTAARSRSGSMSGPSGPSPVQRTPRANGNTNSNHVPSRNGHYEPGNTASLLMDFTEQLRMAHNAQLSPSKEQFGPQLSANGHGVAATPQRKSLVNLLDFEIPPLPTPRSIPTVTPRELESLKSNFLSEISSLKATLSGKEAEVLALKTAVGDAEKRVGECMEQLREERGARDLVSEEKDQWERRGREMEDVLRKVKGEIVMGHRDRDELEAKLDESEKRREAAEMMAQEAETKMAAMRAGRATAGSPGGGSSAAASGSGGQVQREVEIAVERVARELHVAYKAKHETKVAALKKSYEARWEKRVHELETVAEALAQENDKLRIGRDATLSKVVPGEEERRAAEEHREREAHDAAQIKEMGAEVNKLEAVVRAVKADNAELRTLLEQERVEKGELVSLAEEMMSMQQSFIASSGAPPSSSSSAPSVAATPATARRQPTSSGYGQQSMSPRKTVPPKTPGTASRTSVSGISGISRPPSSTGHRNSMAMDPPSTVASSTTTPARARPMSMHGTGARVSGLKPPSSSTMSTGGVPSRIGRIGHDRKMSGSSGALPRPPSGLGTRSGLMSSIEKMGNRGRE